MLVPAFLYAHFFLPVTKTMTVTTTTAAFPDGESAYEQEEQKYLAEEKRFSYSETEAVAPEEQQQQPVVLPSAAAAEDHVHEEEEEEETVTTTTTTTVERQEVVEEEETVEEIEEVETTRKVATPPPSPQIDRGSIHQSTLTFQYFSFSKLSSCHCSCTQIYLMHLTHTYTDFSVSAPEPLLAEAASFVAAKAESSSETEEGKNHKMLHSPAVHINK